MNEVEHYALSLVFCALVGFQMGVGAQSIDDQKEGKQKRFDFIWILGWGGALVYGLLGIKFMDGARLVWIIGFIFWFGGNHFGRSMATSREEKTILLINFAVLSLIPFLYHNILN